MLEPSGQYQVPTFMELFCGIGGFAIGFAQEGYECRGAIDYDEQCCQDHETLTGWPAWCTDIAQLTPQDLLRYVGMEAPDVVALSPPCQGFSGCLPQVLAKTPKYKRLNSLSEYGVWLVLNTWADRPPPMIVIENVPRAAGSDFMERVADMLRDHGYAVVKHSHNCAEIGPLAQNRRRMLLLARHRPQIGDAAPVLLPPAVTPLTVGEVLGKLPVPRPSEQGQERTMHTLPLLAALNWLRLASVDAGKDHHSIPPLVYCQDTSVVSDPGLDCDPRRGVMGVVGADDQSATVIASADLHAGPYAYGDESIGQECMVDVRLEHSSRRGNLGVVLHNAPGPCIIGDGRAYKGFIFPEFRVAGGRPSATRYPGGWGVLYLSGQSYTLRACFDPQLAFASVQEDRIADVQLEPRASRYNGYFGCNPWHGGAHTVVAASSVARTWSSVQEARVGQLAHTALPPAPKRHDGKYGVEPMDKPCRTIIAAAHPTTARASVADRALQEGWPVPTHELRKPEPGSGKVELPILYGPALDLEDKRPVYLVIRAPDGTWHRPMTPLELFVLQGFAPYDAEGNMVRLAGNSATRWKKAIGNAVPPPAAAAIARTCRRTLKAARGGGLMFFAPTETVWVDQELVPAGLPAGPGFSQEAS